MAKKAKKKTTKKMRPRDVRRRRSQAQLYQAMAAHVEQLSEAMTEFLLLVYNDRQFTQASRSIALDMHRDMWLHAADLRDWLLADAKLRIPRKKSEKFR